MMTKKASALVGVESRTEIFVLTCISLCQLKDSNLFFFCAIHSQSFFSILNMKRNKPCFRIAKTFWSQQLTQSYSFVSGLLRYWYNKIGGSAVVDTDYPAMDQKTFIKKSDYDLIILKRQLMAILLYRNHSQLKRFLKWLIIASLFCLAF